MLTLLSHLPKMKPIIADIAVDINKTAEIDIGSKITLINKVLQYFISILYTILSAI